MLHLLLLVQAWTGIGERGGELGDRDREMLVSLGNKLGVPGGSDIRPYTDRRRRIGCRRDCGHCRRGGYTCNLPSCVGLIALYCSGTTYLNSPPSSTP